MSRYIDTDKVYEMASIHEDFKQNIADLTSLKEVLDDTPTADVNEVIHSEWQKSIETYEDREESE